MVNIHGAHSYWKQSALGAAGVRSVWAGAGPQRAGYRGGAYRGGLPPTACFRQETAQHSLLTSLVWPLA